MAATVRCNQQVRWKFGPVSEFVFGDQQALLRPFNIASEQSGAGCIGDAQDTSARVDPGTSADLAHVPGVQDFKVDSVPIPNLAAQTIGLSAWQLAQRVIVALGSLANGQVNLSTAAGMAGLMMSFTLLAIAAQLLLRNE